MSKKIKKKKKQIQLIVSCTKFNQHKIKEKEQLLLFLNKILKLHKKKNIFNLNNKQKSPKNI